MRLEIDSVSKDFAGLQALREVTTHVEKGEILAVIGPNGSGKTTLINVVSGVIRPTSGHVRMDGRVLTSLPSYAVARSGVARTFQNIRLFRDMTAIENIETAASRSPRVKGFVRPRRRSREALARLGLQRYAETVVNTLPYGLQRRVEIARAISTQPHFVLLDEPAAGLNEVESDELLDAIRKVRNELGCGIMIVDHDLRLIMRVSERIHALNEGRTLAVGTPEEVRSNRAVIEAYLGTESTHEALEAQAAEDAAPADSDAAT